MKSPFFDLFCNPALAGRGATADQAARHLSWDRWMLLIKCVVLLAACLAAIPAPAVNYDFLNVTTAGAGGKFTSLHGNGVITVTNTGGPFLGLNNTVYTSKFTNQFLASGTVQGWLAQADNNANYTNTFYLNNYTLTSSTVFGIWNITEEPNSYRVELFDAFGNAVAPNMSFMFWDDEALAGNIGWFHSVLNTTSGYLSTFQFKTNGIDCDASFWNSIPLQTRKIVVTGRLSVNNADGVVFYFAEPKTNACGIICPTNMVVSTCGSNAVVNYLAPTLIGPCASNIAIFCNPPSGTTFPLGTNTVHCSAVDGQIVVDSCSFTITVVASAYGNTYDFLPVSIAGAGGKFTSMNNNGFVTVTNTGGPFLGLNNTVYSSQFPNLFPASGTVQGWLAQADNNASYTNTFYLNNYTLSPYTVFGIWNITEETNAYRIQLFDSSGFQISPPFNWNFIGYDDDSSSGNLGWYHAVLNTGTGYFSTSQFKSNGIDCDAAFWDNIPLNAAKIVVTGNLGAANADGVVFYFAERKPCGCRISCPTNITVSTCGTNAIVNYPPPTLSGPCSSNVTFSCSPPSGSSFPVGTNRVICTAVNGPQLIDSCSFNVTVLSNCPAVLVDCNCLGNQAGLQTNACQAVIPDLCQFSQCWLSPVPLQCSQSPVAGTVVGPGTYPITVVFTDPSTGQTQSCAVSFMVTLPAGGCGCVSPPSGMAAWWPLDETTGAAVFADLSGNGNAAIVESGAVGSAGSPSWVPGKVAGANYFYGTTARGRASNAATLNFGSGSFSVDCWVKPVLVGTGAWQPIMDKLNQTGATTGSGYMVLVLNGKVVLRVGDGTLYTYSSLNNVNYGAWNFVAVSVDRGLNKVTFSVNGVNESAQALAPAGSFNNTVDLLIGSTYAITNSLGELAVDELELFHTTLLTNDIDVLWHADASGKCKPHSPCTNSVVSIFCPPDTNVETCAASAVVFYSPPVASTSCGTITNLVCTPASGSSFPLGPTTVTCTATDSQGHTASCTFKVTVTSDHTPPTCPPASLSVTGCPPRVPNFSTNGLIIDNCTPVGQISVAQNPPAGTVLQPGVTSVTLTACDAASNCATCLVSITAVYAGAGPLITCPSNIVINGYLSCDSNGVRVTYSPPQVSNGLLVSCSPPSGSSFPFGQTTVTCIATNACGSNQCSFTVTVNFAGTEPPCAPPPSNMVMWLSFDEPAGLTAINSSAGNNGALVNGPARNPGGYVQRSLCFNGVNQYVQVTPYPAMQFGVSDFSLDAWVKPASLGSTLRVIVDHREENGPVVRGYSLFLGANNLLGFQIADGTFINYGSSLMVPADGQWHFVAVTVKRSSVQGIRFYVDGIQDSVPRDPTGHPGSVTAGPCYPFRVGSRSSTVSALFDGCIDEVELFRRAVTAGELQAIYDSRCKGKCRVSCQPWNIQLVPECHASIMTYGVIYNPSPVTQTFNFSFQSLPAGPGCDVPGPTSFTPASGTVTVGPYQSVLTPLITIGQPPGLTNGNCACFQMVLTSTDGSLHLVCPGRICSARSTGAFCAAANPPIAFVTNTEPGSVTFVLSGAGPSSTVLTNARIMLLSPDLLPISGSALPTLTIPPAGGGEVTIPSSFSLPEYDPGRYYRLELQADTDGDGQYEVLDAVPVLNVIPNNDEGLSIRQGINGSVIITWPNPCAILEMNSSPANPAGWSPAPVQTSPWTFTPPGGDSKFFRVRK